MRRELRVLLVEDHQLVREGLRSLLAKESDIRIVGEAEDGESAVRLARSLKPRLVVMDIGLPKLSGLEATRQILGELPDARVLILSVHNDRKSVAQAFECGASGYLQKDSAFEELTRALRILARGRTYLSPSIDGAVIDQYIRATPQEFMSNPSGITHREREVLGLIARGQSTTEIADCLSISVKTVEAHRRNIKRKLNLESVAELTRYAIREGISSMDS